MYRVGQEHTPRGLRFQDAVSLWQNARRFIHSQFCDYGCCLRLDGGKTPLLVREQSLVVEGLAVLRGRLPIPLLRINSDNDIAFINESVITYCSDQKVAFTRSRPYRKNDQAWIEQKNGAVIRRFVGYSRYSGAVAGQTLANLYGNLRLYVNFFQPSFKLLSKHRKGGKTKKLYAPGGSQCR